jgi:carbon monoxide dehydrogenase subunit G
LDLVKISGTATLHASRAEVWDALNDPAVLVATIPGCQRLEEVAPDCYAMTISAGVGSIKGLYSGEVRLSDKQHPEQFVLRATGAGTPGTVTADVQIALAEDSPETTSVTYDADAVVGGLVAGVGQRMIAGVAKKTAAEFFSAVDHALAAGAGEGAVAAEQDVSSAQESAPSGTATYRTPGVFTAPPPSARSADRASFHAGALVGAVAALAGAVVGGWLAGRRRT